MVTSGALQIAQDADQRIGGQTVLRQAGGRADCPAELVAGVAERAGRGSSRAVGAGDVAVGAVGPRNEGGSRARINACLFFPSRCG